MRWEWLLSRLALATIIAIGAFTLSGWGYLILIAAVLTGFIVGDKIDIYQARKEAENAKDSGNRIA